jgi:ubiquinone/menaquinone biosynthesis C-methylase UbiE
MSDDGALWSNFWNKNKILKSLLTKTPTYYGVTRYLLSLNLSKDAKILDAGCGTGKLASFLSSQGYDVLGVDISDEALALTESKGVKVKKANILEGLPFEDNTFDLVYSDGLLEHFTDPSPIIRELARVSKRQLLTFVPRIDFYSTFTAMLLKPPREYKRPDEEWVQLHSIIPNKTIRFQKIKFGLLAILVEKKI